MSEKPMSSYKHIAVNKSMMIVRGYWTAFSLFSYFDSDDFDDNFSKNSKANNPKKIDDDLDYQPAPGSPSYQAGKKDDEEDDDEDEDPLEQFMKANNNQAKQDLEAVGKKKDKKQEKYRSKELNLYVIFTQRNTRWYR